MKQKIISAIVYAATSLAFADYFDAFFGAGPISYQWWLKWGVIYAAIVGAVLFAIAALVSLSKVRLGVGCALVACLLSWPFFASELAAILRVWRSVFHVVHYSMWGDRLAAVVMLIVSTIYSLGRLGSVQRRQRRLFGHTVL